MGFETLIGQEKPKQIWALLPKDNSKASSSPLANPSLLEQRGTISDCPPLPSQPGSIIAGRAPNEALSGGNKLERTTEAGSSAATPSLQTDAQPTARRPSPAVPSPDPWKAPESTGMNNALSPELAETSGGSLLPLKSATQNGTIDISAPARNLKFSD